MSDQCLFCQIRDGAIQATKVYEDDRALAFRDVRPQAPTHILIIPREHLASLNDVTDEHAALLGHLHVVAKKLAASEKLSSGWRVVINTGAQAGQTVFHIHLHLLGGRALGWPPG